MDSYKDINWSFIAEETERLASGRPTWTEFGELFELRRQIFLQRLMLPSAGEWNYPIWTTLTDSLLAYARRTLPHLDRDDDRRNLQACISEYEDEIRLRKNPPSEASLRTIAQALGLADSPPADPDDWWKEG